MRLWSVVVRKASSPRARRVLGRLLGHDRPLVERAATARLGRLSPAAWSSSQASYSSPGTTRTV